MKRNTYFRFAAIIAVLLGLTLFGCDKKSDPAASDSSKTTKKTIKIGASPDAIPLVKSGVKSLEAKGYTVEVVPFDDFFVPNVALDEGSIDANFYQHDVFLKYYNKKKGTNIKMVMPLYNFYRCLYSRQADAVDKIPEGGQFAIANDASNINHSLRLMRDAGLITLKDEKKDLYSIVDIVNNPKKLDIVQLDYVQRVASFDDLAGMVNASNVQFMSGVDPMKDVLYKEVDNNYAIGLCINLNSDNPDDKWVRDMIDAYTSDEAYQYVMDYFKGAYTTSTEFEALIKSRE